MNFDTKIAQLIYKTKQIHQIIIYRYLLILITRFFFIEIPGAKNYIL